MAGHPIIEAATAALSANPLCPHVVMVTVAQPARCDECASVVVARAVLRTVADLIAARYPTDVWPEDSQHPESRVAAGVRLACGLMRYEASQIESSVGGGST